MHKYAFVCTTTLAEELIYEIIINKTLSAVGIYERKKKDLSYFFSSNLIDSVVVGAVSL